MQLTYEVVEEGEFPHGLRCVKCDRPIDVGQPYTDAFIGHDGDNVWLEITCVYC